MKMANFINGGYMAPANGCYLDSHQPATGRVHASVPDSDRTDIDLAVAAGIAVFPDWSATSAAERAAFLNRIADLLEQRLDDFAEAESLDQGKPVWMARSIDIPRAVTNFRFFAGAILHHQEQATDMDGQALNYSFRKPMGVAGLISPWNLPMYLMTWKIAPAIAVGNCAVVKPSELTSLTAYMFGDVLRDAGLPPGVCNIVMGRGERAGAALVQHPDVPLISFTGGTETAVHIQRDAAPFYKKLSLELGGKNPNIIFADADLEKALPTAVRAAFSNQGEICLCGSRIFVQRPIFEAFRDEFVKLTQSLTVGDPRMANSNLGPLVSAAHREKVMSYIHLAREEGGEILAGGDVPLLDGDLAGGYFVNPTVVTGLAPTSRVMCEEIFGPVVTLNPFDSEEEIIGLANGIRYGLAVSLWTRDLSRAHRVAQTLDAGIVWVNTWMLRDLRTPFGGMKASGIGREGGDHSIDFYTEQQNICIEF